MEQNELLNEKKWFSNLGIRYFILTVLMLGVQIGGNTLLCYLIKDQEVIKKYQFLISMLPMYIIAVPIGCFIISRQKATPVEKHDFTFKQLLGCFAVGYAFMYAGNIVGSIISNIIAISTSTKANTAIVSILTGNDLWQNILIGVICAPIIEEFIMRKLLIDRIIKYGEKTAILVSAITFGIYHGNITQFVYAALFGLILGYVYVKSGKVIYTMGLHMTINFIGSVLGIIVLRKSGMMELVAASQDPDKVGDIMQIMMNNIGGLAIYLIYAMCLLALTIVGIIVFALNIKKINLQPGEVTLPKGTAFKTIVLNVGAILFIITWLGIAIYSLIAVQ